MTDRERPRGAVFLDRDGTIIDDPAPGYLRDPAAVRLLPGAAPAVRSLNEAGWPVVVVTNQSGIARGLYGAADYYAVQRRLDELLRCEGARIDRSYFCPHHPEVTGPCDCRKPGTKLFRDARADLADGAGIDFACSWFVGDRPTDVEPARRLGGHGLLVLTGQGGTHRAAARVLRIPEAPDLAAAVRVILGHVPH